MCTTFFFLLRKSMQKMHQRFDLIGTTGWMQSSSGPFCPDMQKLALPDDFSGKTSGMPATENPVGIPLSIVASLWHCLLSSSSEFDFPC
jgi:hypothetical protein